MHMMLSSPLISSPWTHTSRKYTSYITFITTPKHCQLASYAPLPLPHPSSATPIPRSPARTLPPPCSYFLDVLGSPQPPAARRHRKPRHTSPPPPLPQPLWSTSPPPPTPPVLLHPHPQPPEHSPHSPHDHFLCTRCVSFIYQRFCLLSLSFLYRLFSITAGLASCGHAYFSRFSAPPFIRRGPSAPRHATTLHYGCTPESVVHSTPHTSVL